MPKQTDDQYYLRSGLVISSTQHSAMEEVLSDLMNKIPAQFILLADVTGQVISKAGDQSNINLVGLASLVAGDLAASQEIARLTGQYQESQMVLREGSHAHIFILDAGHHLALLAQVSNETPLGWARMLVKKGAQQLADIAAEESPRQNTVAAGLGEDDLSDLVSEALDDIWLE